MGESFYRQNKKSDWGMTTDIEKIKTIIKLFFVHLCKKFLKPWMIIKKKKQPK